MINFIMICVHIFALLVFAPALIVTIPLHILINK